MRLGFPHDWSNLRGALIKQSQENKLLDLLSVYNCMAGSFSTTSRIFGYGLPQ